MTEADAKALIEAAQKGDKTAFEALVVLYYDTIFKFAMKWCGDVNNAEDIAQNACMKLARSIDSYNFKAAFTSWLYRLVVNVAIDWQRSQARHEGAQLSDESGHVGVSVSICAGSNGGGVCAACKRENGAAAGDGGRFIPPRGGAEYGLQREYGVVVHPRSPQEARCAIRKG